MEIRSLAAIQTAENVTLQVELAGLGNRVFAFAIDLLAMASLMTAVALVFGIALAENRELTETLLPLLMFVIFFCFQFFQEWLWNGKTLGKHVLGIRVVRRNGQPIGFWEAFGRNLLRVVDVYLIGIGLVSMLISARETRFGDFLAGTLVIREQPVDKPFGQVPVQVASLTPEEQELLRTWHDRRSILLPAARQDLRRELESYFSARLRLPLEQLPEALEHWL